jgi:hypothetical protein
VSIVAERTNETCTPRLRCTPEQFRHRKMPCLMEHQSGLDAAQSAHVCDDDDDGDDDLLVHVERVSVRVVERDTGRATRIRRGEGSSLSSVSRFCSLVVVAWSRRETASRARRTPHAAASRSLHTTRVPRIGGHDERGRGSTRARDATRGSTTADEPRTHLILRELVQLVHLPLVVIPHGPGRARA